MWLKMSGAWKLITATAAINCTALGFICFRQYPFSLRLYIHIIYLAERQISQQIRHYTIESLPISVQCATAYRYEVLNKTRLHIVRIWRRPRWMAHKSVAKETEKGKNQKLAHWWMWRCRERKKKEKQINLYEVSLFCSTPAISFILYTLESYLPFTMKINSGRASVSVSVCLQSISN